MSETERTPLKRARWWLHKANQPDHGPFATGRMVGLGWFLLLSPFVMRLIEDGLGWPSGQQFLRSSPFIAIGAFLLWKYGRPAAKRDQAGRWGMHSPKVQERSTAAGQRYVAICGCGWTSDEEAGDLAARRAGDDHAIEAFTRWSQQDRARREAEEKAYFDPPRDNGPTG